MKLSHLIQNLEISHKGPGRIGPDPEITHLHYDSRKIDANGLFVAVKGFTTDGHDYIADAVKNGAAAVICENAVDADIPMVRVLDSRKALAIVSDAYFNSPSRELTLVGITGTNGKTTTSYLIESILKQAGFNTGVIGTINYRFGGHVFDNPVTTPESFDLQHILSRMQAAGVTHVVMEVSSHALDLYRVHGCRFKTAVFTNITQDHLDFHGTMASYWESKKKLFFVYMEKETGTAVVNIDDPKGQELAAQIKQRRVTTGLSDRCAVHPKGIEQDLSGIKGRISTPTGAIDIHSSLAGSFNVENILNAVGVGVSLKIAPDTIKKGINAIRSVPGRLESIENTAGRFVYVDYAHTPDALENALKTLRELTRNRIVTVFGCGGDRDNAKRSLMGEIAARFSDLAIVTSDNPRTEDPDRIIEQVVVGVLEKDCRRYTRKEMSNQWKDKGYGVIPDRAQAISVGIRAAAKGDAVLIAGKGHETYQILKDETILFDDREKARKVLAAIDEHPNQGPF